MFTSEQLEHPPLERAPEEAVFLEGKSDFWDEKELKGVFPENPKHVAGFN